ncbi:MAG TPA: D-alanyl-D-alanine carboxypeptidase [Micavibrio sp.]|nr:D-alanyl-D-alanine carboxypeptidase [Micavibrio sp.]HIL29882.1 D-alanyl-D-alanine carboxypeptidase [Micavibrio sp.]
MAFSRVLKNSLFCVAFALLLAMCASLTFPVKAQAANPKYAALVMDADTGLILFQRYPDKKVHPASLAKTMTILLAFEAIKRGDLTMNDRVIMSKHAASMVPSKLDLPVGSSIRVEDAIYALVTKSANDVAAALAEKIGGTESHFAVMMTRKARQIGMTSTTYRNASGLHDPAQITTARDQAKLAQYMLKAHRDKYHYFSTSNFTYRGKSYHNHNRLMETYKGMDGFKTGYIQASGFNLLASAKRDKRRLIGVVFGGRTSVTRNNHMKDILDQSWAKLDNMLLAQNAPIPQRKPESVVQLASMVPAAGREIARSWADLNPSILQGKAFSSLLGEGDIDPSEGKRLETGLLAISAVTGERSPYLNETEAIQKASTGSAATQKTDNSWSIQVGAFTSRVRTDKALRLAYSTLPGELQKGKVTIAPLKTKSGYIFRGRMGGFSKGEAQQACAIIKECLLVSPYAQ